MLNKDDDNKIVKRYIEKINSIHNDMKSGLNQRDLNDIAIETGLSELEMKKINDLAQDYKKRGLGYFSSGLYKESIEEFNKYRELMPLNFDAYLNLSKSYLLAYNSTNRRLYKTKALENAKKCVELSSDNKEAFNILKQINKNNSLKSRKILIFVLSGGILFILFIFTYLSFQKVDKESYKSDLESVSTSEITGPDNSYENPLNIKLLGKVQLPSLNFYLQSSEFRVWDSSYSISFNGHFTSLKKEIIELIININIYDINNKLIHEEDKGVLSDYQSKARPGDSIPFSFLSYEEKTAPDIGKIELNIKKAKAINGLISYPGESLVPILWEISDNDLYEFEITERNNNVTSGFGDKYNYLIFTLNNNGNYPINHLKATVRWYYSDNEKADEKYFYFVANSDPYLEPGKKVSYQTIGQLSDDKELERYTLSIVELY